MKRWQKFIATLMVPISLWSMAPCPAWGQQGDKPRVAIVGFQPAVTEAEKALLEGLQSYLSGRKEIALIPEEKVSSYLTSLELKQNSAARESIKKAEEFYRDGKRAYELLKANEAISAFESALRSFDKSFAYLESNRYLLMTYLYLGMSKLVLKKKKAGLQDIRQMVIFDSKRAKRKLSSKFFPPEIINSYNKIKSEVIAKSAAKVQITSVPAGSRVILDGVRVGRTPYRAENLSEGEHRVTVYRRGYERWTAKVRLKSGDNNVLADLKRNTPFAPLAEGEDLFADNPLYAQAAKALDADILILASLQPRKKKVGQFEIYGQALGVKTGDLSKIEKLAVESVSLATQRGFRFGKLLMENVDRDGLVVAGLGKRVDNARKPVGDSDTFSTIPSKVTPSEDFQPPDDYRPKDRYVADGSSTPFYKSWWFWGIVGGVAAGGAAGVFLLTDIAKNDADTNVLVINNPNGN